MTTTATLSDDLELREGDEFVFCAVAKNGALVVTRVIRSVPEAKAETRPLKPGFAAKWGGTMGKISDPADVLLAHINEKHVK